MNDLQLTKESIANEGIEIKLTQADVIDALVDEQMEIIINRYDTIHAKYEDIDKKLSEIRKNALNAAIDLIEKKLPKNITIASRDTYRNYNVKIDKSKKEITFKDVNKYLSGNNSIQFNERSNYEIYSGTYSNSAIINLNINVKDLTIKNSVIEIDYSFKYPASLIKEIKEHNLIVEKFCEEFPQPISPSKISKSIKNKFTKEILKTSSPEFKKKLKSGFGITF